MKLVGLIFVAGLFVAPLTCSACTLVVPSTSFAAESTFAAVAHAVSDRWDSGSWRLLVRVAVDEIFVGSAPKNLEAISACAAPVKEHERLVVAIMEGVFIAIPASIYEPSFRQAFAKPR